MVKFISLVVGANLISMTVATVLEDAGVIKSTSPASLFFAVGLVLFGDAFLPDRD